MSKRVYNKVKSRECSRKRRQLYPNEHREYIQKRVEEDPEYHKRINIQRAYGLSLEEYKARLDTQKGLCAGCKKPFQGSGTDKYAPALDHRHATGTVREFLHQCCNKAIGQVNESPLTLRLLAEYLEKHNA